MICSLLSTDTDTAVPSEQSGSGHREDEPRGHLPDDLSCTAELPNPHVSAHDTSKELGESSHSLPQVGSSSLCTDIGLLMKNGKDVSKLPDSHQLEILRSEPNIHDTYPATYLNGCNRRFKVQWLSAHPWLSYSRCCDGAYCKACVFFAPEAVSHQKLGVLVTDPFRLWTSQSSVFERHEKCKYHLHSMERMANFIKTCANPAQSVVNILSKEREERIAQNTTVLKSLFECIFFCGRQGISLRGHRDDSSQSDLDKRGNFLELVEFRAKTDHVLAKHLEEAPKNATYTSKTIQNEMITVVGDAVRRKILQLKQPSTSPF